MVEDILVALQQAALQQDRWPAAARLIEQAVGAKGTALMVCSAIPAVRPDAVCFWRVVFGGERYPDLGTRVHRRPLGSVMSASPASGGWATACWCPHATCTPPTNARLRRTYADLMGRSDMQGGLHVRLDVPDPSLQIVWALGESTDSRGWTERRRPPPSST